MNTDAGRWWETTEPMTTDEVRERTGLALSTVYAWTKAGDLGPVVKDGQRTLYTPRRVYLGALRKRRIDEDGNIRVTGRGVHRRNPHPTGSDVVKRDTDGMPLLSNPQVADRLGVTENTVDTWVRRRNARGYAQDIPVEDLRESGYTYWRQDTIDEWAIRTERMDPETKKPLRRSSRNNE